MTPANKRRLVVYGAIALVLGLAALYKLRGLLRRGRPVHVTTLEGESAVLPHVALPAARGATHEESRTLAVGGRTRAYVLVSPTTTAAGKTYPLVLVLHGDGGSASSFHRAFPFERASGADAFLAYPDGIGATWDLETKTDNKDLRFMVELVDALAKELPVDRARVYGTGYSSGGFLLNLLACNQSELLRAFTSSAGGAPYGQPLTWPNGYPRCPEQKPVPMIAMHGEHDFGVTLDSGRFSAEYWAYVNGCDAGEMETTGYAECRAYRGCKDGKHVAFCSVPALGHWVWDHAAEASWTFFDRIVR